MTDTTQQNPGAAPDSPQSNAGGPPPAQPDQSGQPDQMAKLSADLEAAKARMAAMVDNQNAAANVDEEAPAKMTAQQLDDLIGRNFEVFSQVLESHGAKIVPKNEPGEPLSSLSAASPAAPLSPNDKLRQHMASYNPGVTHNTVPIPAAADAPADEDDEN